MIVVGLTGGIGSGKSTVADLFADRGVNIIDTDAIARELTEPGTEAYQAILGKFGAHLAMGNKHLNRKMLRKIIFNDSEARNWLEKLLHPMIRHEMNRLVNEAKSPYCIVAIPLLFETEPNPLINRTLVVDTEESNQISRTQARDMHTPVEIEKIMKSQISRAERLAKADDIINNDGSREDLIPQVEKLHQWYLSLTHAE